MDECSEILKHGIWSTQEKITETEFAERTINYFRSNTSYSKQSVIDAAQKVGITLPVEALNIPMNLDGTFGISRSKSYSQAIVEYFEHNVEFRQLYIERNVKADQGIVSAWLACKQLRARAGEIFMEVLPKYLRPNQGTSTDDIILEITCIIPPGEQVEINRLSLNRDLQACGCELGSKLQPLINGKNTLLIRRNITYRNKESAFNITTNKRGYSATVILAPVFVDPIPVITREYDDIAKVKEEEQHLIGSLSHTFTFQNKKGKDVSLSLSYEFDIYGIEEEADLGVTAGRLESPHTQLLLIRDYRWNYWTHPKFTYGADIPFYKDSIINVNMGVFNHEGRFIERETVVLKCIARY